MNASGTALIREDDVQSKIRKVSVFGRGGRVICAALFGFGLVGTAGVFLINLLGLLGVINPAVDAGLGFAQDQKAWALPLFVAMACVWLGVVYQLYRLFGSLAAGAIYTAENVRLVRHIGLNWLLLAVLGIFVPLYWLGLESFGLIEPLDPAALESAFSWGDSLNGLASAGLILLASWVMDVGLYEKNHAAALQRDADLVI